MANKKLKIGVLFGGKSAEHEVSVNSARNVINALNSKKYQVISIKIGKDGKFDFSIIKKVDVVFPVLHGPFGEDGSMQGFLKLTNVPYVGAGVLGSAVGMDKDVMKRLLRDADIPIGKFIILHNGEKKLFSEIEKTLGLPVFVKPANLGSSVGISKVKNKKEWHRAIKSAFFYDSKIIVEENIPGREIECSVLGNEKPMASVPGEIIANQEFYSYDAKYAGAGSEAVVPAKLNENTIKRVQELAVKVFKTLNCEGMGRVDFFVKDSGEIIVNEINTIPGFTSISMYPKLWEASGIPVSKLVDKLIELAIERFKKEQKLKTTIA
ncbi:MAG: D-alanine-D-alanine ligase [Parcubacteria group bacterium GW2011_GWB1_36_5]|nr:MAG: D-alanine-D-alanine ligase [Parcubacteria group bacterium GW2011_GWA2_36_24]KKQ07730.1 MAG: D-alanine-D-alanine ligase [Parcubacteria group bacterium GW2011_GWB1_36_5]